MREHVKVEVALEIISMYMTIALANNDLKEVNKLNLEKEKIYIGDKEIIEKVINKYGQKVKETLNVLKPNIQRVEEIKKKYELSESEIETMYLQAKTKIISGDIKVDKLPTAIVTGGQPGAGKAAAVLKSKKEFLQQGKTATVLDVDIYRGLYKNAFEIAKNYPELYSEITDKAVGKITGKLIEDTIEQGYNFIFEGTMGKSAGIVDQLSNSNIKYNTIARLMAVSREESLLSIFERYLEMRKSMGMGRLTTIEAHDIRYEGFPSIANTLESKGIEVEVYERGKIFEEPILTYKTSSKNNKYKSVNEALKQGRERSRKVCLESAKQRLEVINKEIYSLYAYDKNVLKELEFLNSIINAKI